MKTQVNVFPVFSLFMALLFFASCNKDELSLNDLSNRAAPAFTYSPSPGTTGDSVFVTFYAGNDANCGHVQIQMDGPEEDDWVQVLSPVTPEDGYVYHAFIPEVPGEYNFRAKYTRTGNPKSCDYENTGWVEAETLLLVEGDSTNGDTTALDSCETLFTGEVVTCDSSAREVVYTFVSDEDLDYFKIQGGLTSGVDGDPEVTVVGTDADVSIRTPGNSTNRIIKIEGSAVACDTITITVSWTSTKNGAYITGDWSVSGDDEELEVEELECE